MSHHTIELGAKVRDKVSGYEGVATARYEYMNGCERYEVSGADKDGKPEGFVFDVQQLTILAEPSNVIQLPQPEPPPPTGGPRGTTPVSR